VQTQLTKVSSWVTVSPQRMLLLQQSALQQLYRVELLSYDGKKGDRKS